MTACSCSKFHFFVLSFRYIREVGRQNSKQYVHTAHPRVLFADQKKKVKNKPGTLLVLLVFCLPTSRIYLKERMEKRYLLQLHAVIFRYFQKFKFLKTAHPRVLFANQKKKVETEPETLLVLLVFFWISKQNQY